MMSFHKWKATPDHDEEVEFREGSKKQMNKLTIALVVLVIVLVILCVVFIALYAVERGKDRERSREPRPQQKICSSKKCLMAGLHMLKQLNQSADPCTDFYEYACGGWEDENELKSGQTFVTGFSLLREKSYDILKDALANASTKYKDNEAVMKAVNFFDACNNVTAVELAGDGPLKKLIDNMGGWNVTGNMTSLSTMDIVSRMAKVARELFVKPFIDVKVFIDPHDSKKHIVQFAQGALGMSPFRYTINTTEGAIVREAYKTYMKKVAKLLGGGPDSDSQMMQVYELEKQLAELDRTAEASVMIETLKKALPPGAAAFDLRTSLEDFSTVTKMKVEKVIDFVEAYFLKQKRTFNKDEKILAYPLQYFLNLFDFFENQTSTNPVVVVNYIIWSVVDSFIKTLPAKYREANNEFTMSITGNKTTFRWNECINHMQPFFGMPLGLLFVDAAFDEGSKETIEQMTQLMKDEFIKSLDSLPWMSSMTKKNAKNKANGIEQDIGYPSYIKDPKELAAKIKGLTVGDQLFQNALNGASFVAEQSYGSLDKEVDKDKWFMSPSQVNGYYSPRQNRIVFLAAILQPPFYNPSYPSYINYGGIGMVIGHEITHGFDGTGRLFDKDGNINNWWSIASGVGFKERELCLSRQYSQFEVYGQKVDGNKTLNENIADNGGIRLAFNAYKTLVDKQGTEGALPGLGLTEEQLFFVGFARPWCSIYKKKAALQQLATDSHTFPQYRIIGTLHNYDKFAEAFKCKPGAAMNPKQKCTLW